MAYDILASVVSYSNFRQICCLKTIINRILWKISEEEKII